jgi:hypothetical protein
MVGREEGRRKKGMKIEGRDVLKKKFVLTGFRHSTGF